MWAIQMPSGAPCTAWVGCDSNGLGHGRSPAFAGAGDFAQLGRGLARVRLDELRAAKIRDVRLAVESEPIADATPAVNIAAQIIFGYLDAVRIHDTERIG